MKSLKTRSTLLVLVLAAATLAHATVCRRQVTPSEAEKLDGEYAEALAKKPGEPKNTIVRGKVHGLLNRAFYPMMSNLKLRLAELSPAELKALITQAGATPVTSARYELGFPHLAEHLPGDYIAVVHHNASAGYTRYNLKYPGGEAERFLFIKPSETDVAKLGVVWKMFGTIITPVGPYGEDFAGDMIRTTQVLMEIAMAELPDLAKETFHRSPTLLAKETARGGGAANGTESTGTGMAPLGTMAEGILTIHQMFGLFLGEKVPGAETGEQALWLLAGNHKTRGGIVTEFTRRVPMGLVGPMAITGHWFKEGLTRDERGGIGLSDVTRKKLREFSDHAHTKLGLAHGTCPMASVFRGKLTPEAREQLEAAGFDPENVSGLQLLAEMYFEVYEAVRAARLAAR